MELLTSNIFISFVISIFTGLGVSLYMLRKRIKDTSLTVVYSYQPLAVNLLEDFANLELINENGRSVTNLSICKLSIINNGKFTITKTDIHTRSSVNNYVELSTKGIEILETNQIDDLCTVENATITYSHEKIIIDIDSIDCGNYFTLMFLYTTDSLYTGHFSFDEHQQKNMLSIAKPPEISSKTNVNKIKLTDIHESTARTSLPVFLTNFLTYFFYTVSLLSSLAVLNNTYLFFKDRSGDYSNDIYELLGSYLLLFVFLYFFYSVVKDSKGSLKLPKQLRSFYTGSPTPQILTK